jgi:hypothetical protein
VKGVPVCCGGVGVGVGGACVAPGVGCVPLVGDGCALGVFDTVGVCWVPCVAAGVVPCGACVGEEVEEVFDTAD